LPRPRAVLAISAHWFINGSAVTAMPKPRVIHDFYGFPQQLFDFDYPAPGAPKVADEIVDIVKPACVSLDQDSWGLDHGTWSVLAHVFPRADVPVLQLSIHAGAPMAYHLDLGARLAPLRERGIFIVGSGNIVHNLRRVDWSLRDSAYDWGQDFDAAVKRIMCTEPKNIGEIQTHPSYGQAVPTMEHFLPLVYFAGLCDAAKESAEVLVEGGTLGAITMTSYVLGMAPCAEGALKQPAAPLPDPKGTPPEQTNT
ncbi:MAG TPA: 4,5-DOPA dioxygenase extradiol, partial [Burkholderiales bacterium]|nr:4,5-DOPA dioxygenase extradiol [Burkholderiales bacterium]